MHEFDKCCFCQYYNPRSARLDKCSYYSATHYCLDRGAFILDVSKVIDKAKLYNISVTDVLNLMREVTK